MPNSFRRSCVALLHIAAAAALLPSCSSSSSDANISFAQLGDVTVNQLSGSGMNGDLLARGANGEMVRWRVATSVWEHVGHPFLSGILFPRAEDDLGNIYGEVTLAGNWVLSVGTMDWVRVPLMGADTDQDRIFGTTRGELVMQSHRGAQGAAITSRIYRKAPGSTAWVLASERPEDNRAIVGLADNGDVFLASLGERDSMNPTVLRAGSSVPAPVVDCSGAVILPYCGSYILTNDGGDVLFYGGRNQGRHLYFMNATASYPSTARLIGDLPESTCCFNGGQALLDDGTVAARMNHGGYDQYFLYVLKAGASSWSEGATLPQEDGGHSVDLFATNQGALYTWSIELGRTTSTGAAYRVRY